MTNHATIHHWLDQYVDRTLARHSRVHLLPSMAESGVYIKREDELSSGVSGAKLRKYASLIPFLKSHSIEEVALIGGSNSNNLVGLLQHLKEAAIRPWLFIREAADSEKQGNALFLDMLAPPQSCQFIPRAQWDHVESISNRFLESRQKKGKETMLIPEGGLAKPSLPGALTLAQDVLQNEVENAVQFSDVFIDSGTGMTAIGLILGLAALQCDPQYRRIHVTLIAGFKSEFLVKLEEFRSHMERETGITLAQLPGIDFLIPPSCKSFGSVKPSLFAATRKIAQKEGLLMDPIYSVKHYLAMRNYIDSNPSDTPSLFIYNGSSLGLAGFQSKL